MEQMWEKMIPKETRQCPKIGSEPVGVVECCWKCEYYYRSALIHPCRHPGTAVEIEKEIRKLREIVKGEQ